MIKRIHVNKHRIRENIERSKRGETLEPVVGVEFYPEGRVTYSHKVYCHTADIDGPSRVVYQPDNPLQCGARLWIETEAEVRMTGGEDGNLD